MCAYMPGQLRPISHCTWFCSIKPAWKTNPIPNCSALQAGGLSLNHRYAGGQILKRHVCREVDGQQQHERFTECMSFLVCRFCLPVQNSELNAVTTTDTNEFCGSTTERWTCAGFNPNFNTANWTAMASNPCFLTWLFKRLRYGNLPGRDPQVHTLQSLS